MHAPRSAVFLGSLFKPPYNSRRLRLPFLFLRMEETNTREVRQSVRGQRAE